jgi:hypothetical protein
MLPMRVHRRGGLAEVERAGRTRGEARSRANGAPRAAGERTPAHLAHPEDAVPNSPRTTAAMARSVPTAPS